MAKRGTNRYIFVSLDRMVKCRTGKTTTTTIASRSIRQSAIAFRADQNMRDQDDGVRTMHIWMKGDKMQLQWQSQFEYVNLVLANDDDDNIMFSLYSAFYLALYRLRFVESQSADDDSARTVFVCTLNLLSYMAERLKLRIFTN